MKNSKAKATCCIGALLVAGMLHADVAPFARYEDGMLVRTRPTGWLRRALKVQSEGLAGHPEALSYPYDTCLWAGTIPRKGDHGMDWWRYEQTAYYTDGLLRLGYALADESLVGKGTAGIEWTLEHASPDGHLGNPCLWDTVNRKARPRHLLWPMAVFFRAMKARYDATGDGRIPSALEKYYLLYDADTVATHRNTIAIEGILWTYARTRDSRLLDLAERAWCEKDETESLSPRHCMDDLPLHMHGVTYSEGIKIPMLLYAFTGKEDYRRQAVNAERKLVRDHLLPDGCPSSTEHTRGNSVFWGHETCDSVDYAWSLGYFLEATGDAAYADKIERCVFNAGIGAIGTDFRTLQYFSNLNQVVFTSNSDHNPFRRGKTWMQYRPFHETECCAGNIQRLLPNYISRMWLKDAAGAPVAALYGPCEADFGWARITEQTAYPFDGRIVFRFNMKKARESDFTFRVPSWCRGHATVKVNGRSVKSAAVGTFETIRRMFKDGDSVELDFPMEPVFEVLPPRFLVSSKTPWERSTTPSFGSSSQGTVISRGPLLFALKIDSECTEDMEQQASERGKESANSEFKCLNLRPAAPFNYAIAEHRAEVVAGKGLAESVDQLTGDGFFNNPADIRLCVPVRRIELELKDNRFTPDLPEAPVLVGDGVEAVELVPYGSAMLRMSVFPDLSRNAGKTENGLVSLQGGMRQATKERKDRR